MSDDTHKVKTLDGDQEKCPHPDTANEKLAWASAEIERLRDALTGIYRGAPRMSHAHLTSAAALGLIDSDGRIALPAPDKEPKNGDRSEAVAGMD